VPTVTLALLLAAALSAEPVLVPSGGPPPLPAELTLAEALAELDRQSPGLLQARARAAEAGSLSRQAAAAFLPALSATGSYLRNSDQVVIDLQRLANTLRPGAGAALPGPMAIQPLETFSGGLTLKVPLVAPTAWFDLAAARDGARSATAQADAARLGLRATLATTAHLAAASEEAVSATTRAVANAIQLTESAERKVRAGTAPPLDLLRARTEQVRREGDLVKTRADLEKARLAVGTLLGRSAPVRVLAPQVLAASDPGDEALEVADALARRPELLAATFQVTAAESQVDSARSRFLPQLSASGSAFAADVPYPTGKKDGWRLTVDLTWPLYDGGLRYGKRGEAEARLSGARAAAEAQRLAVGQEVRDAARDEATAIERLRLAQEQRRLADEAAGTAQRGYEAGVSSSLDVVDANDRLYLADIGLAEARARLAVARVALDRARGRGP
jgi:outer membrane protein TolC